VEREKHSQSGQAGKPFLSADHSYWPGDISELPLPKGRRKVKLGSKLGSESKCQGMLLLV